MPTKNDKRTPARSIQVLPSTRPDVSLKYLLKTKIDVIMSNVEVFLRKFSKDYGFDHARLQIEPGSEAGDNFIGVLSRARISGVVKGSPLTLQVVVKSAPFCPKIRESTPIRDLFLREIFAYSEVFPVLDKLQEDLEESAKFKFILTYACNSDDSNEHLMMEDLMLQDYRLHRPRVETLDFDHLSVALTTLAKLHSLSYVLRERNPEEFKRLTSLATDDLFTKPSDFMKMYCDTAAEKALNALDFGLLREKLETFAKDNFNILGKLLVPQKYAVLCHGDYWKNNILFLYKDDKPFSSCALDYQTFRYTSPLTDIIYLIFCCSSQELRKQHFWNLLTVYHDALRDQLERFSLDIEQIFSRKEFIKEVERMGCFGLGSAILDLMFMSCATEDIPYGNNVISEGQEVKEENASSLDLFKERIKGVVEDSIEYGFLSR